MFKLQTDAATGAGPSMSALDAIYERRSVRAYAPQPVERAAVQALLDAAVQAPTAMHEEPWAFVVIQDPKLLRRLSDAVKASLQELEHGLHHPGGGGVGRLAPPENVFYDAGTLIVIYGKAKGPFVAADCWLAAANLMLAARAMGLGSCVIGLAAKTLDAPEWKQALKVPPEYAAYAPIIVGVPAGETPSPGRRVPDLLSWETGLSV